MSTKKEQTERVTSGRGEKKQKGMIFPKPCVYCGPSVRGVARQYTVYTGAIPEALLDFIKKHPAAKGLVVSTDRFAQVRSNLGKSGTAETILFDKIKAEM